MITKILRKSLRPTSGRNFMATMAFLLMLGSLLAPLTPLAEAATSSNIARSEAAQAERAAQELQPLQPLEPTQPGDPSTDPPPGDGNGELGEPPVEDPNAGDMMTQDTLDVPVPAKIQVTLHWCNLTSDFTNAINQNNGELLRPECQFGGPEVSVFLTSYSGEWPQENRYANTFPTTVVFENLTPDSLWDLDVKTSVNSDEAMFCVGNHSHGNTKPYAHFIRAASSFTGWQIETLNDETIHCDWFKQLPDTSTLVINKFQCAEAIHVETVGIDAAKSQCNMAVEPGVSFEVRNDNSVPPYMMEQPLSPTAPYTAIFAEVPEGEILITEKAAEAYPLADAVCRYVDWLNPNQSTNPTNMPIENGNSWKMKSIQAGLILCDVINAPAPETLDDPPVRDTPLGDGDGVFIGKFICYDLAPDDQAQSLAWYRENCTERQNGVTFTISSGETVLGEGTTTNGVAQLLTTNPASGMYVITETNLPDQYTPIAAFCFERVAQAGAQPMYYGVTDNAIQVELSGSSSIVCLWFNYGEPEGNGSSLNIFKFECPALVTDHLLDHEYYSTNCTTPQPGVIFNVSDDNGARDPVTSADPYVSVNGLVGLINISEVIPEGYGVPAVFCKAFNAETSTSAQLGAGNVTLEAIDGSGYDCWFYNIPEPDNGNGSSLNIFKFECPDTVTDHLLDHEYYSTNCTTPQPGVIFNVSDDNGPRDTVTSADPYVSVNGLVGLINISEVIPEGYGVPAVFCKAFDAETSTSAQLGAGNVTLEAIDGSGYDCWFYNIPHDEPSLTLYKWECPEGTMYGEMESYYSAECAMEHPGVPFQITHDGGTIDTTSDTNGRQIDNLSGNITLREMGLPGFGDPVVFCQLLNDQVATQYTSTNGIVALPPAIGDDYQCFWYNIPEPDSTVTIYKWRCPDGMPTEYSVVWFEANCKNSPMEVDFTLVDNKGPRMLTSIGGVAQWTDVSTGAVQITEHVPPGYTQQPFLVCYVIAPNGMASETFTPATVNGTWNTTITAAGSEIVCDWYNWYLGPGDLTVYKWTCPEGYDRNAWGADPMVDCTMGPNGIQFALNQPDPEVDLLSATGDSIDYAVYFGGLVPGDYTITELVEPGVYQDIFVWQCYGLNSSSVHPTPLSVGQSLDFTIVGGDEIVCHWFNVPAPQYGWMIVSKFNCTTEKYVSDVYCYTNQTGQEFNLQLWNGSDWATVQSGITDVSGTLTFNNLDSGEYRLVEPDKQACLMKSSNITAGGNIGVTTGEGTIVHVFNCKTPPPPQKTPTKYPNTGVGAAASESEMTRTPGIEIAGLLALLGMRLSRRRVVAGAGLVTAGTAAATLPLLNAQELVPLDSTPVPGTPSPDVFWCATPTAGTPEAEGTPAVDPCNRGAIPIQMRIPIINVDAPIEYLEIIDGLMQQPTGDTHITWYKETSRLAEVGNGIYAAHVNWYGNPEGIFFRLESLQEGDVIEIDGDDMQTYLYEVQWMQNFPSDEEPPDEALGLTDEAAITLITCGGEWSSALSEYDHRTLVRAVLRE